MPVTSNPNSPEKISILFKIEKTINSPNMPRNLIKIFVLFKLLVFLILFFFRNPIVPDEAGYSQTICLLNQNIIDKNELPFYFSWGPSFLITSQFFNLINLDCISSVRASSLVFSISSAVIFYALANEIKKQNSEKISQAMFNVGVAFFLFLPSKFLWGSIGIREANIEFLTILIVFLSYLFANQATKIKFNSAIFLLPLSLVLLSFTRIFLYYCISIILMFYVVFLHNRKKQLIFISCIMGSLIVHVLLPSASLKIHENISRYIVENKIIKLEKEINNLENIDQNKAPVKNYLEKLRILAKKKEISRLKNDLNISNYPINFSLNLVSPEYSRTIRSLDARSQVTLTSCDLNSSSIVPRFFCNAKYLPVGLFSVLMRPNPLTDWYSSSTKLASIDNILYLSFIAFILYFGLRVHAKKSIFQVAAIPIVFVLISIIGLALYGGNVGTMFRHRSITVWAISLFAIHLSFFEKRKN